MHDVLEDTNCPEKDIAALVMMCCAWSKA